MDRRTFLGGMLTSGLFVIAPRVTRAGACAGSTSYVLVTPPSARIGRGGGIVVAEVTETLGGGERPAGLVLARDGVTVRLVPQRIAPGLMRFVPETHTPGVYELRSNLGTRTVMLVDTEAVPPPRAEVRRVRTRRSTQEIRGRRVPRITLVAEHEAQSARGYFVLRVAQTRAALLSARIADGERSTILYETPGPCEPSIGGLSIPTPSQRFEISVVDETGIEGPPSRALVTR